MDNLNKPINLPSSASNLPVYTPVDPYSGRGAALKNPSFNELMSGLDTTSPGAENVPTSAVYIGDRYKASIPFTDTEEMAAQQQSSASKWANAFGKFVGTTSTTFLSGTVGTIAGIGSMIANQKFSSFYDNPVNRGLDEFNKKLEDYLPNYYTQAEQSADWYSSKNILTANFWSDKVLKNLGFSIGTLASGFAWGSVLKSIGLTNKLVQAGKGLETVEAVENAIVTAPKLARFGAVSEALTGLGNKYIKSTAASALKNTDRALISVMGTMGEASMEALQNINVYRDNLISKFKDNYGYSPIGKDLDEINEYADKVGNFTWGMNVALLSATNYIQLPKIFNSSKTIEKRMMNDVVKETVEKGATVAEKVGAKFKTAPSVFEEIAGTPGRLFGKYVARPLSLLFAPVEAFEEGAQFAVQTGTDGYYKRAYQNKEDISSFWKNFSESFGNVLTEGVEKTLNTKEGLEGILIGGISGGIQTSFSPFGMSDVRTRGLFGEGGIKKTNTTTALNELNKSKKLNDVLRDGIKYINIGINSQALRQTAIANNDKFLEKNYERDYTLSYILPRVKYGKIDSIKEELSLYRNQAVTNEGFQELQNDNTALPGETKEKFIERLNKVEEIANQVNKTYDLFNDKYSALLGTDNKRLYTNDVIDKLVYSSAKIIDFDERLQQLTGRLGENNILTDELKLAIENSDGWKNKNFSSIASDPAIEGIIAKTFGNIDSSIPIDNEEVKQDFVDFADMLINRKQFIDEFNNIKNNPAEHQEQIPTTATSALPPEEKKTITIKTKSGDKEIEIGTEYFLGKVVEYTAKGNEVIRAPKLTILGENEDETIKIKTSNGIVRDISKSELEDYKLAKVSDITSNKKKNFYFENINTIYKHYGIKNKEGRPTEGRLEYTDEKNKLVFVYKDKNGVVQKREVLNTMFKAKEGFSGAMIRPAYTLTAVQQKAQKEFEEDKITISDRLQTRNRIITDLYENSVKRVEEVSDKIEKNKTRLAEINSKISLLITTKEGAPRKRITNTIKQTINELSSLYSTIEKEIENDILLKEELEIDVPFFKEFLDELDSLPDSGKEMISQIKEEIDTLESLITNTSANIKDNQSLLKDVEKVLADAISSLNDYIKKLSDANPNVALSLEEFQTNIERYLGEEGAKQFIAEKLGFTNLVTQLESDILDFTETLQIPELPNKIEKLNEEIKELEQKLKEAINKQIAKTKILAAFEDFVEKQKQEKAEEERLKQNDKLRKEFIDNNDNSLQNFFKDKAYEAASKKDDLAVVTSTRPIDDGKPHQKRANTFGINFNNFSEKKKSKIRGQIVTSNTEIDLIPGLVKHLLPKVGEKDADLYTEKDVIVLVMVNERGALIDENGEVIPEGADKLNTAIYQVFPAASLSGYYYNEKGEKEYGSMFRDTTDKETKDQLTAQYIEWRNKQLLQTTLPEPRSIKASFGIPQYVQYLDENNIEHRDYSARTSAEEAGLITSGDLKQRQVIAVATNNESISEGGVTFRTPMGMVFLKVNGGLAKLVNRKFNITEATTIYDVILQVTKNTAKDGTTKTVETQKLFNWLKSVVYWGIAKDTTTKVRKLPGYNNIWFENVTEDENTVTKLFIHDVKNNTFSSFNFTPTGIQNSKEAIISLLQDLYNNTHASMVHENSWKNPYNEITGIDAEGKPIIKVWKNYQTYLLSDKEIDGTGKVIKQRDSSVIPLVTQFKPITPTSPTNREGIYFTFNDMEDEFIVSKKEEKKEEKKPSEQVPEKKEEPTPTEIKLDGITKNIRPISTGGHVIYTFDLEKAVDLLSKEDPDVLSTPAKKALFIKTLVDTKVITAEFDTEENFNKLKTAKNIDDSVASTIIINVIFNDVLPKILQARIPNNPPVAEITTGEQITRDMETLAQGAVGAGARNNFDQLTQGKEVVYTKPETISLVKNNPLYNIEILPDGSAKVIGVQHPDTKEWVGIKPISTSSFRNRPPSTKPKDSEYRKKLVTDAKRFEGENWVKLESWIKTNFPNVPIYRVKNIMKAVNGKQAWGMLQDGAIYIYENAEVGTVYHEVFEAVWKMFEGPKNKQKIIDEFRNREGSYIDRFTGEKIVYKEASAQQLKEELAEEFRDYVLEHKNVAPSTQGKSLIQRLFADLVNFIKAFFTGNNARINTQKLFDKIGNGYYNKYNPYISKLAYANKGIIDIEDATPGIDADLRVKNIPATQVHEIIQQMTYSTIISLISTNKSLFTITKIDRTSLYTTLKAEIQNLIGWQLDSLEEAVEKNEATEEEIADEYNSLGVLYDSISTEWKDIVEKHEEQLLTYGIQFDENDELELANEEKGKDTPFGDARKIDSFRKSNSAIRLLLASLPIMEMVTITNDKGEKVNVAKEKVSSIGGKILLPADKVHIDLKNKLHDAIDVEEMFNRLNDLALSNINYAKLYTRITRNTPAKNQKVNFKKLEAQDIQLVSAFWKSIKSQNADVISVFILSSGEVVVSDSTLNNSSREAKREMTSLMIDKIKSGNKFFTYDAKTGRYHPTATVKNIQFGASLDQYVKFLNELGIEFSARELNSNKLTDAQRTIFRKAVQGIKTSISKLDDKTVEELEEEKASGKKVETGVATLSAKTLDIDKNLLQLGIIKAVLENPELESTYFNINGERTQTYVGTNTLSALYDVLSKLDNINELNNPEYASFKYILTDEFSKGSMMLKKMFDMEGNGGRIQETESFMKPVFIDGTINEATGKKKESSKQSYKQRLIQEINLNYSGIYLNLVPGDASIEHAIRMHNEKDKFVAEDEDYTPIFKDYFISEVELSRDDRVVTANKNSKDLRFFKAILGEELSKEITSKNNLKYTAEELYSGKPKTKFKGYKAEIDKAVKDFVKQEAKDTEELLKAFGIIEMTSEGLKLENLLLSEDSIIEQDVLNVKLENLAVNYIIANIELHKLVYSDPYQYADELKRIKNFNSPGQVLLHGSENINNTLDREYNKDYKEGDIGYTDMQRDFFKALTAEDVFSTDDLPAYSTPYEESDGGGIITLKGVRVLKIRSGDWTEDNERQYQYDVAYEKHFKNIPLTAKEQTIFNPEKKGKDNPDIKSTYTPIKPIVRGSKANGRNFNDIVLHKFALVPYSFRILHELNPASNAVKFYNKMQTEDVDYMVYASGSKVGTEKTVKIYNTNGTFNTNPFETKEQQENIKELQSISKIPFSIVSIQAEVPSKDVAQTTLGTQITKLVTMDYMEAGVPIDYLPKIKDFDERFDKWTKETDKEGKSELYKEIKNNQKLLEEQIKEGYFTLLKKLGIKQDVIIVNGEEKKTFKIGDREKLIKTLQEEILKREVNDNISSAFDGFKKGDVIIEATPAYQQIRNILYSIADKNVVSRKISGGMKVQISSTLFEENRIEGKEFTDKKGNKKVSYSSDILKFYKNKDGERVCEIMVGRWFKSDLSDEDLLKYLNDTDEGKKILAGVAYRIPTQKQNSIDVFRIAKFLPKSFGDSVVVPSALVKKVGSDFDIDKLSIYFKNVFENFNGNINIVPFYGYGEQAKDKFKNMYKEILQKKLGVAEKKLIKQSELNRLFGDIALGLTSTKTMETWVPIFKEWFVDEMEGETLSAQRVEEIFMNRIEALNKKLDTLTDSDLQEILAEEKANKWYKQSLENEYIQSLEKLISHPLNFENLVKPNSADELKELAKNINKKLGRAEIDYSSVGNMLNRSFMSGLRQAFVSGKYAIGIAAVAQTLHAQMQRFSGYIDTDKLQSVDIPDVDKNILGGNKDSKIFATDSNINFPEYNSINIKGKKRPTLSMMKNKAGEYISDIIGMFIDGYVDISKGPWIMELGATPNVASTWLFLIKLGIPINTVAYFMNQPIIKDYLRNVENNGYSWLFIDNFISDALDVYEPSTSISISAIPVEKELGSMVGKDIENMTNVELSQQQYILKEFLKYAKMANHLFQVGQGSNFDTATINDPYLVFKKQIQLKKAQNTIISSVDDILENSFVGILKSYIYDFRDAFSSILLSDKPSVRNVMEEVLLPYTDMPDRDFVRLAQKAVNDLFDWAVQTKMRLNNNVANILLGNTDEKSAAEEIIEFKNKVLLDKEHPLFDNIIINSIKSDPGSNIKKVNNLYISGRDNKVYDQNLIIYGFEELKKYLKDTNNLALYGRLVRLAVIQSGLTNSKISFTNLLPYNDFKEVYNETLSKLENMPNLRDFYDVHAFERNNANNRDIIPFKRAKLKEGKYGLFNPDELMGKKLQNAVKSGKLPKLIALSKYSSEGRSDFMVYSWQGKISKSSKIKARKRGDYSDIKKVLMKKVLNSDGTPFIHISEGKDGRIYEKYIYKAINAWGDSFKAQEFYNKLNEENKNSTLGQASVLDNDFVKIEKITDSFGFTSSPEVEDSAIINMVEEKKTPLDKAVKESPTKTREYTPENITSLKPNEIFVFGSNEGNSTGGKPTHGRGAALLARQKFGAIQGQSQGLQGQSYAVVTKKYWDIEKSSTLVEIQEGLKVMLKDAAKMSNKKFLVTKLGSSLAGYTESQIKQLFENIKSLIPDNVILPKEYEVRNTTISTKIIPEGMPATNRTNLTCS